MTQKLSHLSHNLIWLDMEMSGLDPARDRILEIAVVVTNESLQIIAQAPVMVIHQDDALLNGMDKWNQSTHSKSGLIQKVRDSLITEAMAQESLLTFLKVWSKERTSPMCGNTICQDRRFMANYMPQLESFFHYRNLDVSTLKELCKRWRPDIAKGFNKQQAHTALADIIESIEELRYYRQYFLRSDEATT